MHFKLLKAKKAKRALEIVCNLLGYLAICTAITGYFLTSLFSVPWSINIGLIGFIMTRQEIDV